MNEWEDHTWKSKKIKYTTNENIAKNNEIVWY